MSFNLRATKNLSLGTHSSLRFQSSDANQVRHANVYINYQTIPRLKASVSLNAGWLQTGYLQNQSYAVRLARPFVKGKWQLETNYRYMTYAYTNREANSNQHIYGLNLSANLSKHLSLFFFAEQTTDVQSYDFTRLQTKAMWRF
jgi:hypothetical protein